MFTLFKENIVNQVIPDKENLSNAINVWRNGTVENIKVHLNITHPFIGDLSVSLTSPSGREVTLVNRQGGSADNLVVDIEGDALNTFIGDSAAGLWTLTVTDHATRDSGTLNTWGIDLQCEEFKNYNTEIFIPEVSDQNVLVSTQECRFNGRVTAAEADVEIEHPLIGDLVVSLVSPAGKEVILHNREGGSQHLLKRHFDTHALQGMNGEPTAGTWTLKVKNFHSATNGMLKHWKIKFRYENVDDLKIVEGIGPKIEQLLNNAGIWSFAGLAATPADTIKSILVAAGDRFKMHDPATWGYQSLLASQGRWEDLDKLKAELVGGKAATA
jgi:subtilisin-like proprotein convertase family protein